MEPIVLVILLLPMIVLSGLFLYFMVQSARTLSRLRLPNRWHWMLGFLGPLEWLIPPRLIDKEQADNIARQRLETMRALACLIGAMLYGMLLALVGKYFF